MGSPGRKWVEVEWIRRNSEEGKREKEIGWLSCLDLLNSQTITSFGMEEVSVRSVTSRVGDGFGNGLDWAPLIHKTQSTARLYSKRSGSIIN